MPDRRRAAEGEAGGKIAVVGMACRVPGGATPSRFWDALAAGAWSVGRLDEGDLIAGGTPPDVMADKRHVPIGVPMQIVGSFDAERFGITPLEARALNPQVRLLMELAVEALDDALLAAEAPAMRTGVLVCTALNEHAARVAADPSLGSQLSPIQTALLNDASFAATQIAYRLDLTGPALSVLSACSSSLAAVHLGCQALRSGDADVCLAGGAAIKVLEARGYLAIEGMMLSPSGVCRPFDDAADGTVFTDGGGMLALMRYEDAVARGHAIHGVILGSAINNDGRAKLGYAAPSIKGQRACYENALENAGIAADDIDLIETHGTGTRLGDPIEIAALTQVYGDSDRSSRIAIGAAKANVGHLDAAAGVVGLIKTCLSLAHERIPALAGYEVGNTEIDWSASPFFAPREATAWPRGGRPRRAGITALGVGGTNVHVILEEPPQAPMPEAAGDEQGPWPLLISAASRVAAAHDIEALASNAWTGQGDHLSAAIAAYRPTLRARAFAMLDRSGRVVRPTVPPVARPSSGRRERRPQIFLFPGQGTQTPGMGIALYERIVSFRYDIDLCLDALDPRLADDIRSAFFSARADPSRATALAARTEVSQPGLVAFEVALARCLMRAGITPHALIGHSLGEISALALAESAPLAQFAVVAAARGAACEASPPGEMLAVFASVEAVRAVVDVGLDGAELAAENAPNQCVLSGIQLDAVARTLKDAGIESRLIQQRYAFHSRALDPILDHYADAAAHLAMSTPGIPVVSSYTGTWIGVDDLKRPGYLRRQLREPVQFAQALQTAFERHPDCVLWEVGPGATLTAFARMTDRGAFVEQRHPFRALREDGGMSALLAALGQAWDAGANVDWSELLPSSRTRAIRLPPPCFHRQPAKVTAAAATTQPPSTTPIARRDDLAAPARDPTSPHDHVSGAPPEGMLSMTEQFRSCWAETLGYPADAAVVGDEADFFEMGGDSLLAIQLTRSISQRTGHCVHPSVIYRARTPQALAKSLRSEAANEQQFVDNGLTYSEEWMMEWAGAAASTPLFNVVTAYDLHGAVDLDRLASAVREVVSSQDRLSDAIDVAAREWRRIPRAGQGAPEEDVVIRFDLSRMGDDRTRSRLDEILRDACLTPIRIDSDRLFRFLIVEISADHAVVVTAAHHIVWDGWSGSPFWRKVEEAYRGAFAGGSGLAPSRRRIDPKVRDYWTRKMRAFDPRHFPVAAALGARDLPATFTFAARERCFRLDDRQSKRLRDHAHEAGTPLSTVLLAAYGRSICRHLALDTAWIRLPVSNRTEADVDNIGFYLGTIVCKIDDMPDRREFTTAVNSELEQALANQEIPPLDLLSMAGGPSDSAYSPIPFEFNYHGYLTLMPPRLADCRLDFHQGTPWLTMTKCEIALDCIERRDELDIILRFYRPLFDDEAASRFATALHEELSSFGKAA